jgi:hypothetical protein
MQVLRGRVPLLKMPKPIASKKTLNKPNKPLNYHWSQQQQNVRGQWGDRQESQILMPPHNP